jgi:hypothetical protein
MMEEINGIYDDNGEKINSDLIPKPGLCLLCKKADTPDQIEDILCIMNRFDQRNKSEFRCGAFEQK